MEGIIKKTVRTFALLVALCATSSAWADTLRVLGDDVAIHSTSASGNLNRSGYAITTGTLSFNTPAGCSAGDPLLFTKLQMVNEGAQNNYTYAQTITITVGDNTYTSGTVVGPATESIGNAGSKSVLTYNFPNVPVQAGSSYSITFNNAGSAGIRYGVEDTNNCTGYTISLTGSSDNWHPYGAITATKVLSSSPDVGDTILIGNTATSGTADASATSKDFFSLSIPTDLGLPNGSVVKVTKVNLAGRNNSYSSNQDPYGIYVNGVRSLNLRGTTTYANSQTTAFSLNTATIMVDGTTSVPRLSYAFGSDCNLTVGTSYDAATTSNYTTSGKGVSLLHANGTPIISGGKEVAAVRHVSASSGVIVNGNVSGYYPVYEMYAEVVSIPTETATISEAGTYTLAGLFASVSDSGRYSITVNESATLNIDAATTVSSLTFNVASNKTLTVTGSALTVDGGLHVTGDGYVNLTSATVSGTLKGDGTVVYTGTATPSGLVFTDNAWEGTLWIEKKIGVTAWEPTSYGSANSTIRMTGIQLYFNTAAHASSNVSFDGTLEVTDTYSDGTAASYGIEINNGFSNATTTFGALKGTGTIKDTDQSATPLLAFNDASEFAGTINLSYNKKIRIGTSGEVWAGEVYIAAGKSVTVASGKTWTSNGGFYVLGTLTLGGTGSTLSGDVNGSGTVVCNQVDLSGSGFDTSANYGWTGKVQIVGGANVGTATTCDEASYGNANSTLEVVSGHVGITTATSLPGTVNVASGATLYMTSSSITDLSISGTNNGTINLSMASSLTTLTLSDGIARGTVVYPSSLTTLNVSLNESIADDGRASITCSGATPTSGTLTLTRPDGTTENVTGTVDGATVSFAWTPSVSGAACWCDYEMDYVSGSKTGFENTGTDTTGLTADGPNNTTIEGDDAFYNGMLYTYAHPWRSMTGDNAYPSSWTAVVRCTVPAYENAAIITFGTRYDGLIGLVAGEDPETQMKLVKTTGDSAYTVLSTMTVQNATTAQHVYVFEVENNSTIKVYCDGDEVLNETYSSFTLGGGIQIGSVHGGVGSTGIIRFAKGENPANTLSETVQKDARIDCVRLYKGLLGPNAIRQLSVEFPAVKLYRATVADGATTDWDSLTWSPAWDDGNEYSKIILTVEGDATLTLPSSITAEDFKIDVASGHVLTLNRAAGGTTITTTNPMEIDNGTMYLADDTSLGTWEIGGTGTVRLKHGAMVTGALSGTAKVEIPSGTTVGVIGGSIANTITGAGVLTYQYASGLPGALSLGDWTGTVVLPGISSGIGVNLNNYGKSGSKVQVSGLSSGTWLENATIVPEVNLAGDMTLTAFSASFANTFNKLSGSRAFSLTADGTAGGYADGYFLIKDVSDFTGPITVVAPGLALGGTSKPSSTEWYGKIVVQAPVTVGSGATWTAGGVVLANTSATLTVTAGATVPSSVVSGVSGYGVKTSTDGSGNTVYSLTKLGTIFSVY